MATLILAQEFYPDMDVNFFLNAFDYMAERFNYFFGKYQTPDERIRALNTYFYRKGSWNDSITFGYDDDDLHVTKLENKFINGYIATKNGSCITMPMLYLILAERLDLPIYPVRSAKHFFLRYLNDELIADFQVNIEATNGGSFISDRQYQADVEIPDKAIENGVYLRTLSKKEYLTSLLLVNANEYIHRKNCSKAKNYLELAIKYDPTFSSAYYNYGLLHLVIAEKLEWKMQEEIKDELAISNILQMNRKNRLSYPTAMNNPKTGVDSFSDIVPKSPKPFQFGQPLWFHSTSTVTNQAQRQVQSGKEVKRNATGLEQSIMLIVGKYKPQILGNLKIYNVFIAKSEELGIVHEFPLQFFQKQAESIKLYKEKGEY